MTRKHILILFCILFVVVVIVVLNSTVFTLQQSKMVFVTTDDAGETLFIDAPEKYSAISAMSFLEDFKGKNILFLSSAAIAEQIHEKCPDLEVVAVRRIFPNTAEVFVAERQAVAYFEQNGYLYLVDTQMHIMEVTSSFENKDKYIRLDVSEFLAPNQKVGTRAVFMDEDKLDLISDTFTAIWRTKFENVEMPNLLTDISVDTYKNIESLVLKTKTGAKIWIVGKSTAEVNTFQKLAGGLAVYQDNRQGDNTREGVNIYCYDPDSNNIVVG